MVRVLGKKHAAVEATGERPAAIKVERTRGDVLGGVNAKAKKRQGLILGAAGLVMVGAAAAYIFPGSGSKKVAVDASAPYAPQISVPDMVNKNLSQREWIAGSENRLTGIEGRLKPVEGQQQQVADLNKKLSDLQQQTQANNANYLHTLQAYETENRKLVDQAAQGPGKTGVVGPGAPPAGLGPSGEPFRVAGTNGRSPIYGQAGGYDANGRPVGGTAGAPDPAAAIGGSELKTISFGGTPGVTTGSASDASPKDNIGLHVMRPDAPPTIVEDAPDYLPPNSYAPARVIVGVDASAGVASQNDPLPVVLRITGPARSVVNHGHVLTTRIEGCVVNGAARGDLSAEKIYVKLAKMTCDQPGGRVAVSEVKGFISFGGKTGVRGRVITREGGLIGQAFLAGIAGGFGRAFTANNESVLGGGNVTVNGQRQLLGPGAIAAGGLGEGVSKSADMVSKYLIERAEQYQPVIEMPTGIDVEIVFLDGVYVRAGR
jgi:conjugal transfer pilus assembly protein TraB